ncbi:RQC domain protein [Ammonifex degensii KC4]|uniref:RQC domain protein n=1 Tax=Ammonifex degensii (strain DSM 10501 / KC4) TaxID=429009 RepID=C9RCL8_AMMDK|nr:RQC domain protein [Ammonifex degensii KC4]
MKVLHQMGARVVGALLAGLQAKGLSVPPGSAGRFRVSKKGNLLLDEKLLLASDTARTLGCETPEAVLELLRSSLSDEAASEIHQVLCSPPGGKEPRQITALDFVAKPPEELAEKIWPVFEAKHMAHSQELAAYAEEVFRDLPAGPPENARAVARARCRPKPEDLTFRYDGAVCLAVCSACGFTLAFSASVGRHLPGHPKNSSLGQDKDELSDLAGKALSRRLAEAGLPGKLEGLAREVKAALAERICLPEVYRWLKVLDSVASGIQKGSIRWQGSGWVVASFSLPSADPTYLVEYFERRTKEVLSLPSTPLEGLREVLRRFWEGSGRKVWEKAEALHSALSPIMKALPEVRRSYENMRRFAEALSEGRIRVTGEGQCFVGNECLKQFDGQTLARILDRLFSAFERAVQQNMAFGLSDEQVPAEILNRLLPAPGQKGGEKLDREVVLEVLRLLAARPKKMGATTVAAVLAGSRAKKVSDRGFDKLPSFGRFKGLYTQQELVRVVERMVRAGLVAETYVGVHGLRVLYLPREVEKALLSSLSSEEGTLEVEDARVKRAARAIQKHSWGELAEMARDGFFPAEAALAAAAALWPSGKAPKLLKELRTQKL